MGRVHQIGDDYYVEFQARGLVYQQKAGKDFQKAQLLLDEIEGKIARGELQTIVREITLDAFFAEVLAFALTQYHPHTVDRLRLAIEDFKGFMKCHRPELARLSQVTPRLIEDYKTALMQKPPAKANPKIVNLTLLLLREVLEHGRKLGYINDNPTLHIRLLESDVKSLRLPDDELERILQQTPDTYRPMWLFLRHSGLRLIELTDLIWQQVDWNRKVVFVKYREVPINGQALMLLKNAFHNVIDHKASVFPDAEGQNPHADELRCRFDKAVARAGLAGRVSIAHLRHSFACQLLHKRISFLVVGKILGIHDIAKLMIYAADIPTGGPNLLKEAYGA